IGAHLQDCDSCRLEATQLEDFGKRQRAIPDRVTNRVSEIQIFRSWRFVASLALAASIAVAVFFGLHKSRSGGGLIARGNGGDNSQTAPLEDANSIRDGRRTIKLANGSLTGLEGLPSADRDQLLRVWNTKKLDVPKIARIHGGGRDAVLLG